MMRPHRRGQDDDVTVPIYLADRISFALGREERQGM